MWLVEELVEVNTWRHA